MPGRELQSRPPHLAPPQPILRHRRNPNQRRPKAAKQEHHWGRQPSTCEASTTHPPTKGGAFKKDNDARAPSPPNWRVWAFAQVAEEEGGGQTSMPPQQETPERRRHRGRSRGPRVSPSPNPPTLHPQPATSTRHTDARLADRRGKKKCRGGGRRHQIRSKGPTGRPRSQLRARRQPAAHAARHGGLPHQPRPPTVGEPVRHSAAAAATDPARHEQEPPPAPAQAPPPQGPPHSRQASVPPPPARRRALCQRCATTCPRRPVPALNKAGEETPRRRRSKRAPPLRAGLRRRGEGGWEGPEVGG